MSAKWPDTFEEKYFKDLLLEITHVLMVWYQWVALFEQPEDRLAQMGKAGRLLLGSVERVFYWDVVLGICRVTDPDSQSGNNNISIRHFESAPYGTDSHLKQAINVALEKSKPLRQWRNKRLSHIDVNTGIGWKPPQGCGRDAVSQSLEAICAVLRRVSNTVGAKELLLGGEYTSLFKNQVRVPTEKTLHCLLQGYQHTAPEK